MTVSNTNRRVSYAENGVTTIFAVPFRFLTAADLVVIRRSAAGAETVLTLNVDYTVAGVDNISGGTLTLTAAAATGNSLLIKRVTTRLQPINFTPFDPFPAKTQERGLDRLTLAVQEDLDELRRALFVPDSDPAVGAMQLPSVAARAGLPLVFDAFGRPTVGPSLALILSLAATPPANLPGISVVTSMTALRAVAYAGLTSGATILMNGYYAAGDLGAGVFRWDAASVAADDGGLTINPTGNVGAGRWRRIIEGPYNVRHFGARGDGVANDRAAIAAAAAIGPIRFDEGRYLVSSNLTIVNDVTFMPGARLVIPTGVTVTFSGAVNADVAQIFECTGTGKVVFNWIRTWKGYPEWWGAKGDLSVDCFPSIQASLEALLWTQLQGGDYICDSTPRIIYSHRTLAGVGSKYNSATAQVTRLLIAGGTSYALQVGLDANPGTINSFAQGITVKDLYVGRTVAPVIASNPVGVQVQWALYTTIENVRSDEHMVDFRCFGTVQTRIYRCEAMRSLAGTGAGTDYFTGFWTDGSAVVAGLPAGNASILFDDCVASCNNVALRTGQSRGFYLTQRFTDTWLSWPETNQCFNGIDITGTALTGNEFGNVDCKIVNPINDQFHNAGIYITGLDEAGGVTITEPYCGPATDGRASIWINASNAAVTITSGHLFHGFAPNVGALLVTNSTGVSLMGTLITECGNTYPVVDLSTASNCRIMPTIKNRSITGAAAVRLLNTCNANVIAPIVMGKASAFTIGIQAATTTDGRSVYDCGGIDSACIAGGSANKLVRNGVQIIVTGVTGTNEARGPMG